MSPSAVFFCENIRFSSLGVLLGTHPKEMSLFSAYNSASKSEPPAKIIALPFFRSFFPVAPFFLLCPSRSSPGCLPFRFRTLMILAFSACRRPPPSLPGTSFSFSLQRKFPVLFSCRRLSAPLVSVRVHRQQPPDF